jgi:hypothetical protein
VVGPAAEPQAVRIVVVSHAVTLTAALPPADLAAVGAVDAVDAVAVAATAGGGTGMAERCSIVDRPARDGSGAGALTAI